MMLARRVLLLLDGIDEGGSVRDQIEEHITEVLRPQGHVMVVTSRPAGLSEEKYDAFEKLKLKELTLEQQLRVVDQRLEELSLLSHAKTLHAYVKHQVPLVAEEDWQEPTRITGNPLMLSMVCSIFEGQMQEEQRMRAFSSSSATRSAMPETERLPCQPTYYTSPTHHSSHSPTTHSTPLTHHPHRHSPPHQTHPHF